MKKKYAVVTFIEDNTCEVIPTIWMNSENETSWPNTESKARVAKLIRDCSPPSTTWQLLSIKTNSFTNSFNKALRKAKEIEQTSHVSSDSSDDSPTISNNKRKRQKPARYVSDSTRSPTKRSKVANDANSSSESESVIDPPDKKHKIPPMPGASSQSTSSSQAHLSRQILQNDYISPPVGIRIFETMEKMYRRIREMDTKIDNLHCKVDKITNSNNEIPGLDYLPDDINLPVSSVDDLFQLNEKLKYDREFSAILVRFLHSAGSGKTPRAFILSLTKKILSQEVAVQFSRFGGKGKKPFTKFIETLNVILAATSMKFKEAKRDDLAELFGKSLAGASDWNNRKLRPSVNELEFNMTFTETEM